MFNLDHITLAYQLIWRVVRTTQNANFISAGIKPLQDVYANIIALRTKVDYELQFNGQVVYLQHILNDQFDDVNRQIYISDGANIEFKYIYTDAESATPLYINTDAEVFNSSYIDTDQEQISTNQFIVNIPATGINIFQLKSIIDKYKLAGKNYTVVIF